MPATRAKLDTSRLMSYFAFQDRKPKAEKFHVEGEIFRDLGDSGQTQLSESPVISVGRHLVASDKKDAFVAKFKDVKGVLEDYAKPFVATGGWKEDENTEEWLLFIGWPMVQAHKDFAQSPSFTRYREILEFIAGFNVWQYHRIQCMATPAIRRSTSAANMCTRQAIATQYMLLTMAFF